MHDAFLLRYLFVFFLCLYSSIAFRGVIDAGRAGINRARGYGNVHGSNSSSHEGNSVEPDDGGNNLEPDANVQINDDGTFDIEDTREESFGDYQSCVQSHALYRRRSRRNNLSIVTGMPSTAEASSPPASSIHSFTPKQGKNIHTRNINPVNNSTSGQHYDNRISPVSSAVIDESIAGLLGLDEEFQIGANYNGEDDVREVQLRAL